MAAAADKEKIMHIVKTITESTVPNKEKHFAPVYKVFKNKYPQLFALACKSGSTMDMKTLEYLLDMLDKVQKQETTQEDASIAVGQALFNQFVDVSKLTPSTNTTPGQNFKITTTTAEEVDP